MNQSMLDLYTDYLISSFGPTTATGLSRLVDGEVSHDQVTRFLAAPAKTSADLWRLVKPMLRQVESPDGVLIFDDSIEEKPYTDENDLICRHWDHAKERHVKGINFITAFYATETVSVPVAFDLVTKTELYTDAKTGKKARLVGVIVPEAGDASSFFKLMGDPEIVGQQKDAFIKFIQTAKFGN